MGVKIPIQIKAAAELELRRRQKERAANCYFCELETLINEVYQYAGPRPICPHDAELQDINSNFNQKLIANMEEIYPDTSGVMNAETTI